MDKIIKILTDKVDDSIQSFEQFPKENEFLNLYNATMLFIEHVKKGSRILLIHDSDADGCGCYMISHIYFTKYFPGLNVELIITDRSKGYGFRPYHITDRENQLPDLIITSDNGITSHDACDLARSKGIDVIITDHHQVDMFKGLPNANFIVDPHQDACTFPYPDINGSFVYWYFIDHFHRMMGGEGNLFYEFLPELCLTTISDVMPLKHINRYVVKEGLKLFNTANLHHRQWVRSFHETKKGETITAEDLGFNLIPSINVAARLSNAEEAAIFLTRENRADSLEYLAYLRELNDTRKAKQQQLMMSIENDYSSWLEHPFILIPGEKFTKGLLGPVSGRLAEHHKCPAIVLTKSADGLTYSGSGRSIGEINILDIIKHNPFIIQDKTGGHKAACGVSFKVDDLIPFWQRLQEDIKKVPKEQYVETTKKSLGLFNLNAMSLDLYYELEKFAPFGKDFERPIFESYAEVTSAVKMGKDKNHYNIKFKTEEGVEIRAVWFFFNDTIKRKTKIRFKYNIMLDTFSKDEVKFVLHIKEVMEKEKL